MKGRKSRAWLRVAVRLAVAALVLGVFVAVSVMPPPKAEACMVVDDPFEDRCPPSASDHWTVIRVLRGSEEFAVQLVLLFPEIVEVSGYPGDVHLEAVGVPIWDGEWPTVEVP